MKDEDRGSSYGNGPSLNTPAPLWLVIAAVAGGIIAAVPIWYILSAFGVQLFERVGVRAGPQHEYAPSVGSTVYFFAITLLAIFALWTQKQLRLHAAVRAFAVAFFAVLLGLFTVCDIFSVAS